MESLIILFFELGLYLSYVGAFFILAFVIGIFIQLVSYRVFNYNLYKKLNYILFDKELRK